jgi:hypothetical protein
MKVFLIMAVSALMPLPFRICGVVEGIVEDFSAITRLLGVWLLGTTKDQFAGNPAFFMSEHSFVLVADRP